MTDKSNGNGMTLTTSQAPEALLARVELLEERLAALEAAPAQDIEDRVALVVFSGDLDKAIAAFIIATGAAAMGLEVSMFFTFWGMSVLKKEKQYSGKDWLEKGFTAMLPSNSHSLGLSQMNFMGAGSRLLRRVMAERDVASLEELIVMAQELGVRLVACDMSRELLGIHDDELIDGIELGGVASFLGDATRSKSAFFI